MPKKTFIVIYSVLLFCFVFYHESSSAFQQLQCITGLWECVWKILYDKLSCHHYQFSHMDLRVPWKIIAIQHK